MERTNLVEIANKAIKGAENLYISNSFQALASGDASEIQSICIQVGQNTIDDAGMSLNIYDTDYGFWVTLIYNLD